ncbi:MAG: hypothetical protein LBL62_10580 [Planctomycetaceae bacterium]|nr:hypothetical protein [Planctomycetaceae bacterium]
MQHENELSKYYSDVILIGSIGCFLWGYLHGGKYVASLPEVERQESDYGRIVRAGKQRN